jgi:hypothetical protein
MFKMGNETGPFSPKNILLFKEGIDFFDLEYFWGRRMYL